MKVVSVINYKGGVGKTTITANLGVGLAQKGYKVLLLDLDPQTNLTLSFYSFLEWDTDLAPNMTIKRWFDAHITEGTMPPSLSDLIVTPKKVAETLNGSTGRLDLIASHLNLVNTDMHLARELFRDPAHAKKLRVKLYRILADALEDDALADYDYVLIDCAPDFGLVTQAAVVASRWLLVPSKADQLSSLSISYFTGSVNDLVKDYNSFSIHPISPRLLGVVFSMVEPYGQQPTRIQRTIMSNVARNAQTPVFHAWIRDASKEAIQSVQSGIPTIARSGADKALVAEFVALRDEFLKMIEVN